MYYTCIYICIIHVYIYIASYIFVYLNMLILTSTTRVLHDCSLKYWSLVEAGKSRGNTGKRYCKWSSCKSSEYWSTLVQATKVDDNPQKWRCTSKSGTGSSLKVTKSAGHVGLKWGISKVGLFHHHVPTKNGDLVIYPNFRQTPCTVWLGLYVWPMTPRVSWTFSPGASSVLRRKPRTRWCRHLGDLMGLVGFNGI